jgi:hypothetical protein
LQLAASEFHSSNEKLEASKSCLLVFYLYYYLLVHKAMRMYLTKPIIACPTVISRPRSIISLGQK